MVQNRNIVKMDKNINFSNSAHMNWTDVLAWQLHCKLVKARQAFWSQLKLLHTRKPASLNAPHSCNKEQVQVVRWLVQWHLLVGCYSYIRYSKEKPEQIPDPLHYIKYNHLLIKVHYTTPTLSLSWQKTVQFYHYSDQFNSNNTLVLCIFVTFLRIWTGLRW